MSDRQALRCKATNSAGDPCEAYSILGGEVCVAHGGAAPQVRQAAKRRLAEKRALRQLGDVEVDEIRDPIRAMKQTVAEVVALKDHLASMLDATPMTGATSETWRWIMLAFERQLERSNVMLDRWIRLGLDDRAAGVEGDQAALVARVIFAFIDDPDMGLDFAQRQTGRAIMAKHMRVLTGSDATGMPASALLEEARAKVRGLTRTDVGAEVVLEKLRAFTGEKSPGGVPAVEPAAIERQSQPEPVTADAAGPTGQTAEPAELEPGAEPVAEPPARPRPRPVGEDPFGLSGPGRIDLGGGFFAPMRRD
jgi:hypothetical protein